MLEGGDDDGVIIGTKGSLRQHDHINVIMKEEIQIYNTMLYDI